MTRLTQLIHFLKTDNTQTMTQTSTLTGEMVSTSQYEVIENEVLKCSDFKGLNISGSLFSLTTFVGVTFRSCVFFGSKIENCEFINCKFIDCSFQFSNISYCNFSATSFQNCSWDFTPVKKSVLRSCDLNLKTTYFLSKEDNQFIECFSNEDVNWGSTDAPSNNEKIAA